LALASHQLNPALLGLLRRQPQHEPKRPDAMSKRINQSVPLGGYPTYSTV